jgi:hypothetical protein
MGDLSRFSPERKLTAAPKGCNLKALWIPLFVGANTRCNGLARTFGAFDAEHVELALGVPLGEPPPRRRGLAASAARSAIRSD